MSMLVMSPRSAAAMPRAIVAEVRENSRSSSGLGWRLDLRRAGAVVVNCE
jgi:hypothetical protein